MWLMGRLGDRFPGEEIKKYGTPGAIRTPDTRFRKPLLYPSELLGYLVSLILTTGQASRNH
jgi:hypothetical protein